MGLWGREPFATGPRQPLSSSRITSSGHRAGSPPTRARPTTARGEMVCARQSEPAMTGILEPAPCLHQTVAAYSACSWPIFTRNLPKAGNSSAWAQFRLRPPSIRGRFLTEYAPLSDTVRTAKGLTATGGHSYPAESWDISGACHPGTDGQQGHFLTRSALFQAVRCRPDDPGPVAGGRLTNSAAWT